MLEADSLAENVHQELYNTMRNCTLLLMLECEQSLHHAFLFDVLCVLSKIKFLEHTRMWLFRLIVGRFLEGIWWNMMNCDFIELDFKC